MGYQQKEFSDEGELVDIENDLLASMDFDNANDNVDIDEE